jgi:hypothetical protein
MTLGDLSIYIDPRSSEIFLVAAVIANSHLKGGKFTKDWTSLGSMTYDLAYPGR